MIPAAGSRVEEDPRSLPDSLRWEILDVLEDLPALATREGRRILIVSSELGVELEDRIEDVGELERFCELLLDQLMGSGRLPDGRHPLEAALKAARRLAGPRDYEDYDLLLRQVRAWLAGEAFPRVPERGRWRAREIEAVGDWWVSSDEILHCVREEEIAKIRESLESVPQSGHPHVCLLFGGWGVGKTALLKLLASSLAEERFSLFSWLKGRTQRKILVVPQAGAQVEPLILRIYRAFSEEEQRKFLGDFRKRLRKHQEGLRSLIEAKTSVDSEPDLRGELMNLVEPGGLMLLDLLSGTTGTAVSPDLVAGLLKVSPSVSQKLGNWLKSLSREDLGSLSEIRRNLASALAEDLARMSRKHEAFVLAIDGYDACTLTCNHDLLDLVRYSGPRVFWIFAGRFEHPLNSSFKLLKESLQARFNEIPLLPLTEKEIFDLLERIQHRTVHRARTAAELKWFASQILKVTEGRFPLVETALQLWQRGVDPEEDILQLLLKRLEGDLEARYKRFLYAFILLRFESREDRSQILRSLLDKSQDLSFLVRDLAAHYPLVSESSTTLLDIHQPWVERLREYLTKETMRLKDEILEVHDRACQYLTAKRGVQESRLKTLAERLRDERWQEIELPRIHHHFHLDIDQGWLELAPTVLGAWAIGQKGFLEQILEMLQWLRPIFEGANERRLKRFESGLAEQACTQDRIGLLDELERLCVEVAEETPGTSPEEAERRQMIGRLRGELESQLRTELAWAAPSVEAETPASPEEDTPPAPTLDASGPEPSSPPEDRADVGRDASPSLRIGAALFLRETTRLRPRLIAKLSRSTRAWPERGSALATATCGWGALKKPRPSTSRRRSRWWRPARGSALCI